MFEKKRDVLAPRHVFITRQVAFFLLAALVVSIALGLGVLGYHHFGRLNWIDSLLNASMILSGMGPVDPLPDDTAKVFASMYALFSGVVFISTAGIMLTPIFHRILHKFHIDEENLG